ncbi:MAG: OmpA family protein [Bradymonadales bacterium]|jgi:outer membrane protein OmpA-like peptidoglycan-associated protein
MLSKKTSFFTCLLLCIFCYLPNAIAQEFDSRAFYPIAGANGAFSVESSEAIPHLNYNVKLMTDYANRTLRFNCGEDCEARLEHLVSMNLGAALGVLDFLEFGLMLPIIPYEAYNKTYKELDIYGIAKPQRGYIGDMQIRVKGRILDRESYGGFGLGAGLILGLPTGQDEAFVGDGFVTARPYFALDYGIGPVEMFLNLGFSLRQRSRFLDYELRHGFNYGFGIVYHAIKDVLDIKGEVFAETPMSSRAKQKYHNNAEWLLGLKWMTKVNVHLTAGAGMGIGDGVRSPRYRVLFGLEYQPLHKDTDKDGIYDDDDECINVPGLAEYKGCPHPDQDEDGWCDEWIQDPYYAELFSCKMTDLCPTTAGIDDYQGCPEADSDKDGWCEEWVDDEQLAQTLSCKMTDLCPTISGIDKNRGCPDSDTDQDGWCDEWVDSDELATIFECKRTDLCPLLKGEDEFQGCPNPDADSDGICHPFVEELNLAAHFLCTGVDLCPDVAEDFDDFQDDDGCPDFDNDNDGICDPWVSKLPDPSIYPCRGIDMCPNEPETINGYKDDDGCPDKGRQIVIVTEDRIEIKDKVFFDTNKATIKKKSFSLLDQVALTILAHRDIKHVVVEGHTDDRGKRDYNLELSRERAKSVMDFLISRGVSADRLSHLGYGPDKPLDPAKTRAARALNRRVEFMISK